MATFKNRAVSSYIVQNIIESTEGTVYSNPNGTTTDIRYKAVISNSQSGLSFGATQLDCWGNSVARKIFKDGLLNAVNAGVIDNDTAADWYFIAQTESLAKSPLKFTQEQLSTIENYVLPTVKDEIDAADAKNISDLTDSVGDVVDKVRATWGDAGVFEDTNARVC